MYTYSLKNKFFLKSRNKKYNLWYTIFSLETINFTTLYNIILLNAIKAFPAETVE